MQQYITYSVLISAVIQVVTNITNIKVITAYKITQSQSICNHHSCHFKLHWENFQKMILSVKEDMAATHTGLFSYPLAPYWASLKICTHPQYDSIPPTLFCESMLL